MLKALKKGIKRLGSSGKLHEEGGDASDGGTAAAAAAAPKAALTSPSRPPGLPRPPSAHGNEAKQQQHAAAVVAPAAEGGAEPASAQATAAAAAAAAAHEGWAEEPPGGLVDYELVAGPLELDTAEGAAAAAAANGAAGAADDAQCEQQGEEESGSCSTDCVDACSASASASGVFYTAGEEEEGAAVAAFAAEGADGGSGAAPGAAPEGGAAAEGGGAADITEALATMMYFTEDAEGNDDCVSVVSEVVSDDKDFPDDISELSRALEALEGEALGSSPGAPSPGLAGAAGGLEDQIAERLGISPDADPTAFAQQMAKLYNNLGLKMMERRKHEEALGLLRKAEAVVENDAMWPGRTEKRQRMQAITYNNLGCLFKRHNMPQVALQYLQKALTLERAGNNVQNSSSTHLNICAALSALRRPKEALAHAEQAIILLQRHLWAHHVPFQEGLASLVRQMAAPGAGASLLASANVLAMAYHNAAVEHEKLLRLREALVSFTRAYLISSKCLGAKAQMTTALSRALKAFQQRQGRHLPTGAAHAVRKVPSRSSVAASQAKRGHSRAASKPSSIASKSSGNLSSKALAAAGSKATIPLDKGRTTAAVGLGRPPSSSRLASQHHHHHHQQQPQQQQQAQQQQVQQQQPQRYQEGGGI